MQIRNPPVSGAFSTETMVSRNSIASLSLGGLALRGLSSGRQDSPDSSGRWRWSSATVGPGGSPGQRSEQEFREFRGYGGGVFCPWRDPLN